MLFHEVYGSYYHAVTSILKEAVEERLTGKEMDRLIQKHAFGESFLAIPEGLKGEKWRVLRRDLSTPIQTAPYMPMTLLEKRWLKALLFDPRIQLFDPDISGLEGVEPLFTPDMFVYYDRYIDGDNYSDSNYKEHFRTILMALKEKRNLYICFETGLGAQPKLVLTPQYLEYSAKDDRFRLIASGRKRGWTINLSSIKNCQMAYSNEPFVIKEPESEIIVFELVDQRKALERVLLHFSHLEKETKKLSENKYEVRLIYDRQDETEMVIRILSFGPVIKVTHPSRFINLLKERIEKQRKLATYFPEENDENRS